MHTPSVKELAVRLRREGYSYPYIAEVTGLAKSTLSDWLGGVPYRANAEMILLRGKAVACASERRVKIRQESIKRIENQAKREIGHLSSRDLFMFGLGLYLGEGSKTQNIRIVNSDPRVICAALAWFRHLGVRDEQFSPRLFIYPDNDLSACLQFWANKTRIPRVQFQKEYIDTRSDKKKKRLGKLRYGTLHLSIRSGGRKEYGIELLRKIEAWSTYISEQTKRD